jgi:hypothetical protein
MSPRKGKQKSAKSSTAIGKKPKGFTDEERVAMQERIQELWPVAFALKELTATEEARIGALLKKAVS